MKYEHQFGDETRFENQLFIDPEYLPKDLNSETNISNLINNIDNCPDPYENFIRGGIMDFEDSGVKGVFDYNKIIDREDESIERKKQIKTLIAAIRDKYKEKNREIPRTIRNWINGGQIDTNSRKGNAFSKKVNSNHKKGNRFKLYEFCMVMDMDIKKTANFFWKYFGTIAFNLKNRDDAIFYYCMKNSEDLKAVDSIYDSIIKINSVGNEKRLENTATVTVYNMIDSLNESDFIEYIANSYFDYNAFYLTAKKKIENLCNYCQKQYALGSRNAILNDIYGDGYTAIITGSKKSFPKIFQSILISENDLSAIINGNILSYEKIRRALIILNFYCYHKDFESLPTTSINDIDNRRKEFRDNTNEIIIDVGFEPLYPLSSFDWIILYLANQQQPLKELKMLCSEAFE